MALQLLALKVGHFFPNDGLTRHICNNLEAIITRASATGIDYSDKIFLVERYLKHAKNRLEDQEVR